ncbi:MAG: hypothetical protein CMJ46_10375 [Planctomyces sp.]|nr:hypothetical protein [Planctomyces sp.]
MNSATNRQEQIYLRSWNEPRRFAEITLHDDYAIHDCPGTYPPNNCRGFFLVRKDRFFAVYAAPDDLLLQVDGERRSLVSDRIRVLGPINLCWSGYKLVFVFSHRKLLAWEFYRDSVLDQLDEGIPLSELQFGYEEDDWWQWVDGLARSEDACRTLITQWNRDAE